MELEGSLKAFPLPEVLQFLAMGKMSGFFHLRRETQTITLTIKTGRIVNSSTLTRNRRLGEMLVQRGLLKRQDLDQVLGIQKTIESDKRLGEILVEQEYVSTRDLEETARLQLEEEVWDLFSWDDGQFKFEHAEEKTLTEVLVQIDIEPLLLEGSRRQDEWSKIRRAIPTDQVVLEIVALPQDYQRHIKLSPTEWKVLSAVNGVLTVEAVTHRCALGRFTTCHILTSFLQQGLVKVASAGPALRDGLGGGVVGSDVENRVNYLAGFCAVEAAPRGFGSLFGGKPKAAEKPAGPEFIEVSAPIAQMSVLVGAFTKVAMEQKDFAAKPEEARLLENLWKDLIMRHPRADLVGVSRNLVDSTRLEAYVDKSEDDPALQECHEEAVEAVSKLLKIVYQIASQRLGEKAAQKFMETLVDAARERLRPKHGQPFDLKARCYRALGIAA